MKKYGIIIAGIVFSILLTLTATASPLSGDVNDDGRITSADYIMVKKYFAKKLDLSERQLLLADANGDGKITSADYLTIRKIFNGTGLVEPDPTPELEPMPTCLPNSQYYNKYYYYNDLNKLEQDVTNARKTYENSGYRYTETWLERFYAYYLLPDCFNENLIDVMLDVYNGAVLSTYQIDNQKVFVSLCQYRNTAEELKVYEPDFGYNYDPELGPPDPTFVNKYEKLKIKFLEDYNCGNNSFKVLHFGTLNKYEMYLDDGNDLLIITIPDALMEKYGMENFAKVNKIHICEPIDIYADRGGLI